MIQDDMMKGYTLATTEGQIQEDVWLTPLRPSSKLPSIRCCADDIALQQDTETINSP
jgi:DNA-binding transcriptional regulator YhcF (GntR family)